jgi:hypothetical protein
MLILSYPLTGLLWTMVAFFALVILLWLLFMVWSDLFRRDDLSGLGKVAWLVLTVLAPFVGVILYVLIESDGIAQRSGRGPWKWA